MFLNKNEINFINEQDGQVEREFKLDIKRILHKSRGNIRAYLAKIKYSNKEEFNIALCFRVEQVDNDQLLKNSEKIFKKMFNIKEHLDIVFLDEKNEVSVRKVCCPFYISDNNQFHLFDFYLSSSEQYNLRGPRECYKRKKLYGKNPDGYMLCDIKPEILGQQLGLENDINQVVLASRYLNYSLFSIATWPAYVHIAIPTVKDIENVDFIDEKHIKLIGWGEITKG